MHFLDLASRRLVGGDVFGPTAPLPTVTSSSSLDARTLTINVGTVTGDPAPTVTLTGLTIDGADVLAGATGNGPWTYVVPSGFAAQNVAWTITATNSNGSGFSFGSAAVPADLSAPLAGTPLANLALTQGVAMTPVDMSSGFSGSAPIVFSLAPSSDALPNGVGLAANGTVSGTPTETIASRTIVIRATNGGGSAETTFDLTVEEAGTTTLVLNDATFAPGAGGLPPSLALAANYTGADVLTAFVATVASPSTPTAAQIVAGSGGGIIEVSSFPVSGEGTEVDLASLSPLSEAANELHVVLAEQTNGDVSNIIVVTDVSLDLTAPAVLSTSPADGSPSFNGLDDLSVRYDEPVFAGSGSFSIRRVSDASLLEAVDVTVCTVSDDRVFIPQADIPSGEYYVEAPAGIVTDASGTEAPTISGASEWNFSVSGSSVDSFTAPVGTILTAYVGESGRSWEVARDNGGAPVITSDGWLRGNSPTGSDVAYRYAIPETADQVAQCVMRYGANVSRPASLYARMQALPAGRNGYCVRFQANEWQLRQRTGNGGSVLDAWPDAAFATPGAIRTVRLEAQGSSIRMLIDGVLRGSATDATYVQGCAGVLLSDDSGDGIQIEIDQFSQEAL